MTIASVNIDRIAALLLIAAMIMMAVAYVMRLAIYGPAHYERVNRQGGSFFLGRSLKEMGYWGMEPFGRLLVTWHVTANQISWVSLILGGASGTLLAFGYFGTASAILFLASVCDGLDGMVARLTGTVSRAGEVLDSTIDRYNDFFLVAGLAVYYRFSVPIQVLCLLALLGSFMVSYSTAKAELFGVRLPQGGMRRPERVVYLLVGAVISSLTVPLESEATGLAYPMIIALATVAIFSNVTAIRRILFIERALREKPGLV